MKIEKLYLSMLNETFAHNDKSECEHTAKNCTKIAEEFANNQIEKICDSSNLQKIRATKSDAEARRIIRNLIQLE